MKVLVCSILLFALTEGGRMPHSNDLHFALEKGTLDEVKRLVEVENYDVNKKGKDNKSPLMFATMNNQSLEMVKYLVEKGANISALERNKYTPLHFAAESESPSNLETVKYLIEKGAKVDAESGDKVTPFQKAAIAGQLEIAKYLVEKGAKVEKKDYSLLVYSLENGNVEMLKYFVSLGVPLDLVDDKKLTILHHAVQNFTEENIEPIKFLVESGADVNAVDEIGQTPVHYAAKLGHVKILEYFAEKTKANMFAVDSTKWKETPAEVSRYIVVRDFYKMLSDKQKTVEDKSNNM